MRYRDPKDVPQPGQFPGTGDKTKKWFEAFDDWAGLTLGSGGIPLLYVLRKDHAIADVDFAWHVMDNPDADFAARGRHPCTGVRAIHWRSDNSLVWTLLKTLVHPTKDYTWLEPFEATKNGHAAYWALKFMSLGPGLTKALESSADKIIQTIRFDGKYKNHTYSAFAARLQQAFTDTNRTDWTQPRRVKVLLQAITDSRLAHAVMHIETHPTMQYDYQAASNFLQETLLNKFGPGSENKGGRGLGAFEVTGTGNTRGRGGRGGRSGRSNGRSGGRGRGRGRGQGGGKTVFDPQKLDAYYAFSAYKLFTPEQKDMIRAAKDSKKTKGSSKGSSQISSLLTSQKETARQIAALTASLEVATAVNNVGAQSIGAAISGKRKRAPTAGMPTYQEVDGVMVRIT
jgi:hypothetical protein